MKSKYMLASCALAAGMLVACSDLQGATTIDIEAEYKDPMVRLSYGGCTNIWYDKDTMVMYIEIHTANGNGITPMLNADGTPKLYKREN